MEDVLESFYRSVLMFIINDSDLKSKCLIKKHTDHLDKSGEFSFPYTLKPWKLFIENCIQDTECDNILVYKNLKTEDLITASKQWHLQIIKVNIDGDRVNLFFDRPKAMKLGLQSSGKIRKYIKSRKEINNNNVRIEPCYEMSKDLTTLRIKLLKTVTENLINLKISDDNELPNVIITNKSTNINRFKSTNETQNNLHTLVCGPVLNINTGLKEIVQTSDSYVKIRQNEMLLIAQHKYGVRVCSDPKWTSFLSYLGEAAVTFELLEVKPSSPVKININCPTGCSKGAAFVLYNCARLETILRTYSDKVSKGLYPPLVPLEDIDFMLLKHEDEWRLIHNYILGFPSFISNCINLNQNEFIFRPHLICNFLCSMVKVFSQYYRRVRVLTEPRKHLLPVMFARIYMLTALSDTLKNCLDILNIKSVSQM